MRKTYAILLILFLFNSVLSVRAQKKSNDPVFKKIKILQQDGEDFDQKAVVVTFLENELKIEAKSGSYAKTFRYAEIVRAEYSYSKVPRWKTGLGLGAAAFVFPPLFLIAIPIGFTKHRRHWLTIRTADDYAVLKLSKGTRKIFMPTFETKTGITIEAIGEDK